MSFKEKIEKLNHLFIHDDIEFSVYDFDSFTMNELLMSFFKKINDVVEDVNKYKRIVETFVDWVKSEGLISLVSDNLDTMKNDGTLQNLINEKLFQHLNQKINQFKTENDQEIEKAKQEFEKKLGEMNSKVYCCNFKLDSLVINVNEYGAKGNANYYNQVNGNYYVDKEFKELAHDDTQAIQTAINVCIVKGGGTVYFPNGKYYINDTIYINPPKGGIPIRLMGSAPIHSIYYDDYQSFINQGTRIICNANVVFSVNRDDKNNQVHGGSYAWYEGFTCENMGFTGVPTGQNTYKSSIAFYIYGCRYHMRNCGTFGLDYFVYSPLKDASKKDNYCDLCSIENIYAKQTQKSLIKVTRSDMTTIRNIFHEEPTQTFKSVVEVVGGVGTIIDNVLSSMNVKTFENNSFESCVILIKECKGTKISNIFTTKNTNLSAFIICHDSDNVEINNVNENGLKKETPCVNMFHIKSCDKLTIKNVTSYVNRKSGHYDFKIEYGDKKYKSNIIIENVRFRNMEKDDSKQSDRLPLFSGLQFVDKLTYKDISKLYCKQLEAKKYEIKDKFGVDYTPLFGELKVSDNKVYFNYNVNNSKNPILHMEFDVNRMYIEGTLQNEPIIKTNTNEELSIEFIKDNKLLSSLDTNNSFVLTRI